MLLATSLRTAGEADAAAPSTRWSGTFSARMTMAKGSDASGSWPLRNFYTYVPRDLPAPGQRSVVVYLHGTSQTAIDAANGVFWNDLADKEKFIVVYPEEATPAESGSSDDGSSDLRGWSWGRGSMRPAGPARDARSRGSPRSVMAAYDAHPGRVFIGGASAGAIMATIMGATYPDLYSAVGSWAGCNYYCVDATGVLGYQRMGHYARVVPSIVFAGTLDYTVNPALGATQVTGLVAMNDLADDGLPNRSVSPRPTAGPTHYGLTQPALDAGTEPGADRQRLPF